jgi:hypothetical protein
MSSLAYPPDNPTSYRIAAAGMTLSGVLLALLGLSIRNSLQSFAPSRWTKMACIFFVLGGLLITVSALITPGHQTLWGLPKAHAKFAQAGALTFDLGMALTLPALLALPQSKKWVRVTALLLVLIPVTTFLLSRLLFFPSTTHTHPPLLGSLAFWEWIGAISVYFYTALIILALNPKSQFKNPSYLEGSAPSGPRNTPKPAR